VIDYQGIPIEVDEALHVLEARYNELAEVLVKAGLMDVTP
jgi:hypothetical protein